MTTRRELAAAYIEGRQAARAGLRVTSCPYRPREAGALTLAYVRGYAAAELARQAAPHIPGDQGRDWCQPVAHECGSWRELPTERAEADAEDRD